MANLGAVGGVIDGVQQGYTFAKEAKRKEEDDKFKAEERDRKRIDWKKGDEYTADVDSLNKNFFPPEPKTTPAPAIGIQAPAAAPASTPESQPVTTYPVQDPAMPTTAASPAAAPMSAAPPAPAAAAPTKAAGTAATQPPPAAGDPALGLPQAPPGGAGGTQPAGMPVQPNQMTSMGRSMDYLIQRAQIDLRHGKIDGAGIANLHKLRNSAAKEGLNEAVQLLSQGDNEGAMRRFNESGDMKDWKVQSSVDGLYKHGGIEVPTKIVTVKAADGATRTVNTAETLVQNQLIDKIVEQAQKGVALDDGRSDAAAGRKIQQQNANTQEEYRKDQAENMREQRRLQELGIDARTAPAPIWGKEDDTFLKEQYSGKDEVSGAKTLDGEGLQFAKQVAVARSRFNGGDATSASAYAVAADNNLKQQAKGDPAKLRQLRSEALQRLATAAPARPAAGGAEWEARSATSRAEAPEREAGRRNILMQELETARDPRDIAALKRELAALGPAQVAAASAAGAVANPFNPPAQGAVAPVRPVAAAARPAAAPAAQTTGAQAGHVPGSDGIDVRNDTVLASLHKSLSALNANDPRNTDALMKLGNAFNTRVEQLQANYGTQTNLITQ